MRVAALFGLLALIPAAAPALAAAGGESGALTVLAADCLGGTRAITIPRDPDAPAPREDKRDCVKGCHAGASRKRSACAC